MKTAALLSVFLLFAIIEIDGGRTSGGGGRSRGGGGRGSSSSSHWGGGSRSSSSTNHQASNNWAKARDRARNPPPSQPKPQPNHDNTRLSYGQHEMSQPKPNDHKPSAPPMETNHKPPISTGNQGSQNINKQTVTNQQSGAPNPSAPNPSAPNAPNAPPVGWNVGQNPQNTHNSQGIGFDNVNKQAAGGVPHVNPPAGTANHQPGINSQNVHPSQNAYNPNGGYHPNTGPGGYNQGGYNQGGYNQGGYNQGGYNQGGYNQGGYHPGGYNQGQGGYHPYPQQPGGYGGHGGYGGYGGYGGGYHPPAGNVHYGPVTYINGASTPSYSYYHDRSDNTLLSLFIGYQVGKMFSHSHTPYFSDRTYEIHHYHHDKTTQPEKVTVQANTIVSCAENITLLCIANAYPVCMSNGTIMCVTNPQLTAPCKENGNFSCVDTKIDCTNNTACNGTEAKQETLSVPCVSSVSIFGDLSMLQNIINTTAQVPDNVTVTSTNNSISVANVSNLETTTGAPVTTILPDASTTTVAAGNTTNTTTTNVITNNIFCVTVIAMPRPVIQATTTPEPLPEIQEKATSPHVSQPHVSDPRSSANNIWPKTTLMELLCIFVSFISYFHY